MPLTREPTDHPNHQRLVLNVSTTFEPGAECLSDHLEAAAADLLRLAATIRRLDTDGAADDLFAHPDVTSEYWTTTGEY